ncbi:MAG: acyl-ACP--UDP-N-acetylglucosamine O-acyltransferase [Elusimicrobia bacterium]|nr:acyl-ACP--UDP-N-acetylglucosamine O-acyltransferase [Elusimicrobiota bacterium]
MKKIHQTAIVSDDAEIADGVEIGPYAIIGPEVKIGENTYIGPHCVIEFSKIGRNNRFVTSCFIGTPPQDYKYSNEKTYVEIGDNNIIREGASIHRGTPNGHKLTKLGSGCFIMSNSHIGHDCVVGDNVIMVNASGLAGHCTVENNAVISGLSGVHQFTRIGSYVMLSGGSMVSQDIIPYVIAQGDRAKPVGLNMVGLKRAGFSAYSIKSIKYAFNIIFRSGLPLEDALKKLEDEKISSEVDHIVEFIKGSKRGISRPKRTDNE